MPSGITRDYAKVIALQHQLDACKREHQKLEFEMKWLKQEPSYDIVYLQRLKKKKLILKDRMVLLDNLLMPDIIAQVNDKGSDEYPSSAQSVNVRLYGYPILSGSIKEKVLRRDNLPLSSVDQLTCSHKAPFFP